MAIDPNVINIKRAADLDPVVALTPGSILFVGLDGKMKRLPTSEFVDGLSASDYVDVRMYGAKGDGIDSGIGNYEGDQDAINEALANHKRVVIRDGVFVVKKPIVLNDGNELYIAEGATLKLGDASNCTLLKNSHVDIYKDAIGVPTYPTGFKRHSNIKVWGLGIIDCNGWMQNRSDSPGGSVEDNPAVVGTPRFADGEGVGSYYVGWGLKFADIDHFFFGGGLTVKNPRTYGFCVGGLSNFKFDNIIAERNYFVQNQDFLNINGKCYDGEICNIKGVSGDEFIVISTMQLGDLTLRSGDIKRINIHDITYWGIDPTATTTNQKPMSTFEDDFFSHRLARISYSRDFIVDNIVIENCYSTKAKLHSQIVIAQLPYSGGTTPPEMFAGNGYIGNVILNNVNSPDYEGLLDFSDYTIIKRLDIINITDKRLSTAAPRSFMTCEENFTGQTLDYTHSKIDRLTIQNCESIVGPVNPSKPWIDFPGEIRELVVDNYSSINSGPTSSTYSMFLKGNVKTIMLSNCRFLMFDKLFELSNNDCSLLENDGIYRVGKSAETSVFQNINTNRMVVSYTIISSPLPGDIIRQSDGLYHFKVATGWVILT